MSYVLSKSGRKLQLPKNNLRIRLETSRKCQNDINTINQWLIDQCIEECEINNDNYNIIFFKNMNIKNMTVSDIDSMNLYLFNEIHPKLEIFE